VDRRPCLGKFESFGCLFTFVCIYLAFVIFGIINFLAILSMHVCSVAWYKSLVLNKPFINLLYE
jgi:hypothetical protein